MRQPGDLYVCEVCGERFETDISDEEAAKDFEKTYGLKYDPELVAIVCERCLAAEKARIGLN